MTLAPWYNAEISRKVLHLTWITTPIVYWFLPPEIMLWLLVPCVVLAVVIELLRHYSPGFHGFFRQYVGFMVRSAEWDRVTGATYVIIGALLTVWLFPKQIAIAVMLIQSISDAAASLVGLRYGRSRFLGKSLPGSLAFFVTAVAILWVVLPESKGVGFVSALVATLAEALPALRCGRFELNDNLTVPLVTGAAIYALGSDASVTQLAAVLGG